MKFTYSVGIDLICMIAAAVAMFAVYAMVTL